MTKGLGKKFERKKVLIAEKVDLFSGRTFFLKNIFGSYGTRCATTMADHSFQSLLKIMKNGMIKYHDSVKMDKENLS